MTSTTQLADLLPAWVLFGPYFYWVLLALLVSWGSTWAACRVLLWPLRQATERHWTEHARLLFPARLAVGTSMVLAITFSLLVPSLLADPSWSHPQPRLLAWVMWIAAIVGVMLGSRELVQRLRGRVIPFRERLRNGVVFFLLMAPHLLVLLALLMLMPPALGPRAWITLGLGALGMGLASRHTGLPLLLLLGLARPASSKVADSVAALATQRGLAPVPSFEVELGTANALALVFSRRLVFSSELVAAFDRDELQAVVAHELAHLSEPLSVRLTRAIFSFVLLPLALLPAIHASSLVELSLLLGLLLTMLVAARLLLKLARRMEIRADRQATLGEELAGTYARALEKLYQHNLLPAVLGGRRVHPELYDRMLAAGVQPAYARPAPPRRFQAQLVIAGFAAAGWIAAAIVPLIAASVLLPSPLSQQVEMAALGVSASRLGELGDYEFAQGDVDRGLALKQLALKRSLARSDGN